ncbi:MAG: GNAT family N-acetyltransferase [Paludibacteraceae bacterium]|nr:GNAT family N-acetyltransferase [Paludibacteraceae bacterium]
MEASDIKIYVADESHIKYVDTILETIAAAAAVRGTGIAKRNPEYVKQKMLEGKAVIALYGTEFAGFSYIETWGGKHYVTTSGLIVADKFRGLGVAKRIKHTTFTLARMRWPEAKIFSLTSGAAVMKLNTEHGYIPVTFAQLTDDETFWKGCQGCINHDVLVRTGRKYCVCTGMLYDPERERSVRDADEELAKDPEVIEIIKRRFPNGFPN